jgi:6-phosphofructokinase 1
MGRKAGHLALGIGKAAGATLTLIPEEFGHKDVPFQAVVDTMAGAIVKRHSLGQRHGVAVIAEGLIEVIRHADLAQLENVGHDEHGHVRLSEIDFGEILKHAVQTRLKALKLKTSLVAKNVGYELRCADPIPYDMEYTRDLGYCAAKYLLDGGHGALVSMQGGHFVPIPFPQLVDPETGRTRVRLVNINSARYAIARRYMIRLRRDDFDDPKELAKFAATAGLSPQEFRAQFEYLVENEPPPLDFGPLAEPGSARGVSSARA